MPPKKDAKKAEKKEGSDKAATDKPKAAEGEAKGKKGGKGKKEKK